MYFLIQRIGSLLILFIVLFNRLIITNNDSISDHVSIIIILSISIKIGVPPLHFWFPEIISKINWLKCYILITLQKIAPLTILSIINNNFILIVIITISVIVGSIGGLNQSSIRKLIAYSSINHIGWIMRCIYINNNRWIIYLLLYTIILTPIVLWLSTNQIYYINQINIYISTHLEKLIVSIIILSLGGLPPFIGFFPKWIVIQYIIEMNIKWTIIIIVLCSLLTLFFYIRIIRSILLINRSVNKWLIKPIKISSNRRLTFIINLILPIIIYINIF